MQKMKTKKVKNKTVENRKRNRRRFSTLNILDHHTTKITLLIKRGNNCREFSSCNLIDQTFSGNFLFVH